MKGEDVEVVVFLEAIGDIDVVATFDELRRVAEDDIPGLTVLLHLPYP